MKRKFDVKLRKVGNSYVVTIPKDTVDRFELKEGDFLGLTFDSEDVKKSKKDKEDKNENT
jgi:putative addiction module antidote